MVEKTKYITFLEELAEESEEREFTYEEQLMAYAYFQAFGEMGYITITELISLKKKLDLTNDDCQKLRV